MSSPLKLQKNSLQTSAPKYEFERIVVEVTEACHHACVHCYNYWRDRRMPVNSEQTLSRSAILELVRKLRQYSPIRQIGLSGGEPLLRDDLPEIVSDLEGEGLSVVVITNATLMTPEIAGRFPKGTIFEFTLFSADARLHDLVSGRSGSFDKVLAGVTCIGQFGHRLALSCVVNKLNAHDVMHTIQLGIALGADAVLLNRINLNRQTLAAANQLVPSLDQLHQALTAADDAARRYDIAVSVSVPIPPCLMKIDQYPHLHFGWCPRGGKDAYYTISHNGQLRPCNHSSIVLGDLLKESFPKIISRLKTRSFWESIPEICRRCEHPLRDVCRGGCPAASDECYGAPNHIDPFVVTVQNHTMLHRTNASGSISVESTVRSSD